MVQLVPGIMEAREAAPDDIYLNIARAVRAKCTQEAEAEAEEQCAGDLEADTPAHEEGDPVGVASDQAISPAKAAEITITEAQTDAEGGGNLESASPPSLRARAGVVWRRPCLPTLTISAPTNLDRAWAETPA